MGLTLVSVPIGNLGDITLRAIETLKTADFIICEEIRPAETLLKRFGITVLTGASLSKKQEMQSEEAEIPPKEIFQLNEHSTDAELKALLKLCRDFNVALISDCGTPGFCDPGANLADLCMRDKIPVDANPGASSLMTLLTLSGHRVDEFYFAGFLPSGTAERTQKIQELSRFKTNLIFMDTPYRLDKLLTELTPGFGSNKAVLGFDLTGKEQHVERGDIAKLASRKWGKFPFVLLVLKS